MLPRPEIESMERQSLENELAEDCARYHELKARMILLPIDSIPFIAVWSEIEQIKNRHGGMPPEK